MRERAAARDVGAMRGSCRLFTEFKRSLWPRVHIRYSETCDGRGVDEAARVGAEAVAMRLATHLGNFRLTEDGVKEIEQFRDWMIRRLEDLSGVALSC